MPSVILSDNGVSSGSAGLKSTAASDGALALQTTTSGGTATTAVSIDTSQNVTFAGRTTNPTTISVGGATPSSSGSGITFPATQSASTDANTLDDYEEGTWTPAFTDGTYTYNETYRKGTYTKIGNRVMCTFSILASTVTGATTAQQKISGLPYASGSTFAWAGTGGFGYVNGLGTNTAGLVIYMDSGVTNFWLMYSNGGSGSLSNLLGTGTGLPHLIGSIVYYTA